MLREIERYRLCKAAQIHAEHNLARPISSIQFVEEHPRGPASAGQGSASVSFTAPASNGGWPITSYTVTATDTTNSGNGGQTASGSASSRST